MLRGLTSVSTTVRCQSITLTRRCWVDAPKTNHKYNTQSDSFYEATYKASTTNPDKFWDEEAKAISWIKKYDHVTKGGFEKGDTAWFVGGKLNVSENCIDRHARKNPDSIAIIWEGDKPGQVEKITYRELLDEVSRLANALKSFGVKKGDTVCIYMPMVPQACYAMLACARIGAVHSVVFAGFSSHALRDRVKDSKCKVLITSDEGFRGGKVIPIKNTVDAALEDIDHVSTVLVFAHSNTSHIKMKKGRDHYFHDFMPKQSTKCEPEPMDSEDPLFILYTSGSTGKPKGLVHTTGGYLTYVARSHHHVFNHQPGDIHACVADIGWITGHSYIVYGPLANGATTIMFESLPTYPDASRYWALVEREKVTSFYSSPTAIRALMKYSNDYVTKHDLSSLRVLGSVGEPINPEAWNWFYSVVGKEKCFIVDTFWQTETGGILATPLPGTSKLKPGATMSPLYGVSFKVIDPKTGKEQEEKNADGEKSGVLAVGAPWPGLARTILGDHQRYIDTYLKPFPGYYFTGDGCKVDKDGHLWITGRVDDVINKSGHRLGTAEIESALVSNGKCVEAAVVGIDDDNVGQAVVAFCIVKKEIKPSEELVKELRQLVRSEIGGIASPDHIIITEALPKTRSGKIMRRYLRKIASGETELGDLSTLADPEVIKSLIHDAKKYIKKK